LFFVDSYYLRQGGNVFAGFCLFVCLSVSPRDNSKSYTSDSILGVIRQGSWILDHFEIFVTTALKGHKRTVGKAKMVTPPGE